jgi:DNA-binding transcriptional regulator YdaS (Cro superfamily)
MNKLMEQACAVAGGQSALAEALGVTPSAVNQWVKGNRPIPAERCIPIEVATGGKVTRYDLRPDVFGVERRRQTRRTGERGRRNQGAASQ